MAHAGPASTSGVILMDCKRRSNVSPVVMISPSPLPSSKPERCHALISAIFVQTSR